MRPPIYLNPSVAPVVQIYFRHNLLKGFGAGVNGRFIRVAQKNVQGAQETFRSQLLNIVANVLNLYWDLVTDNDDLTVRQRAVDQSQKFYDDTRRQIELGVVPRFEAARAQSGLTNSRQLLSIAQATAQQQENLLKNAISRHWPGGSVAGRCPGGDARSHPGSRARQPAAAARTGGQGNCKSSGLCAGQDQRRIGRDLRVGNGQRSTAQSARLRGHQRARSFRHTRRRSAPALAAEPYYVGGLGNALGQVFRDNFPTRSAGALFSGLLKNRVAQGDYGIEQLQLRQSDLVERRNQNQLVVDISNQVVALRQARSRYSQAADSRKLLQELLEKSQQSFSFGAATISDVEVAQVALVAAQETEVATLVRL